jgi:uncharacterized protein YbaP (TraB family)
MIPLLRCRFALAFALALPASFAGAAAPPTAPADDVLQVLDTVVVSGIQPGPGLWRVEKDGRVMWVLGTVAPLPKRMEWNSAEVEAKVAAAGVVLMAPMVRVNTKGAMFGGLFLVPSMLKARNNPDKERLADVLPAADYARWQGLKQKYLPRNDAVEKRRPFLAAMELRGEAFDQQDLSWRDIVGRVVSRAADKADVPTERPNVQLTVENPKAAIKEFANNPVDDLDCFRRTLDQVENDLGTLATRANAWAQGETAMLRDLTYTDNAQACTDALMGTGLAKRSGFGDLPARVQAEWMAAAEKALATHAQSFAVLSMTRVVGPSGYLAALEKRGYTVTAPDEADAAADAGADASAAADAPGEAPPAQ